jgi:hypothetical protein
MKQIKITRVISGGVYSKQIASKKNKSVLRKALEILTKKSNYYL